MKKGFIVFILILLIVIIATFYYMNGQYKISQDEAIKYNASFESYKEVEVLGTDIISVINKAIDINEKNQVQKNEKNQYIENETNSIIITIKFVEEDKTYE